MSRWWTPDSRLVNFPHSCVVKKMARSHTACIVSLRHFLAALLCGKFPAPSGNAACHINLQAA